MKIKFCNKFVFLLAILYIVVAFGNFNVFAAVKDTFTVDDLTYTILTEPQDDINGTVSVKQNTTTTISVTIPSNIINNSNSYDVTAIANNAFSNNVMSDIIIPDSVTKIGISAFKGCFNLTDIIIPDSVTTIWDSAFSNCYKLKNIVLPNNLKVIEDNLFEECYSIETIKLPENLEKIEPFAFAGCYGIKEIVILDRIRSIGKLSFSRCKGLKKITILSESFVSTNFGNILYENELVNNIEVYVVDEMTKNLLRDCCYIPESKITIINNFTTDGFSYHILTEPLGNKRGTVGIGKLWGDIYVDSIVIPSSVTNNNKVYDVVSIRGRAFVASKAKTISIPSSITKIGFKAFENCVNLTSLRIPDSVIEIRDRAFWGCSSLKNIILSNNLKTVEEFLFSCENLESIEIPKSVTSIGYYVFTSCNKLKNITILSNNIEFNTVLYSDGEVSKDIKIYVVNKKVKKALIDVGTPENVIEIIGAELITDFGELDESIKTQEVQNGTLLTSLNLPTLLQAIVKGKIETINEFTWISDKTYKPTISGTYIFTANLSDDSIYEIGENVQVPTIKVIIKHKLITGFEKISEDIAIQKVAVGTPLDSLTLPNTLKVIADGKEETLTEFGWSPDIAYDPTKTGRYIFTSSISDNNTYLIADEVKMPFIQVIIDKKINSSEDLKKAIELAKSVLDRENSTAHELVESISSLSSAMKKFISQQ